MAELASDIHAFFDMLMMAIDVLVSWSLQVHFSGL
jgi:hypothetical protein